MVQLVLSQSTDRLYGAEKYLNQARKEKEKETLIRNLKTD